MFLEYFCKLNSFHRITVRVFRRDCIQCNNYWKMQNYTHYKIEQMLTTVLKLATFKIVLLVPGWLLEIEKLPVAPTRHFRDISMVISQKAFEEKMTASSRKAKAYGINSYLCQRLVRLHVRFTGNAYHRVYQSVHCFENYRTTHKLIPLNLIDMALLKTL